MTERAKNFGDNNHLSMCICVTRILREQKQQEMITLAIVTKITEMLNNDLYENVSSGDAKIRIPRHYSSKKSEKGKTDYNFKGGLYINASMIRIYDPLFDGSNAYHINTIGMKENPSDKTKYLIESVFIESSSEATPLGKITQKLGFGYAQIKNINRGPIKTVSIYPGNKMLLEMYDGSEVMFRRNSTNNTATNIVDEFWR